MSTETHTHRVAMMVMTQVIMDVEAPNDVDSIKKRAIEAYFNEEGEQEQGFSAPMEVVIYPWLEQGQEPPTGSAYPKPTNLMITTDDLRASVNVESACEHCNCQPMAEVIPIRKS